MHVQSKGAARFRGEPETRRGEGHGVTGQINATIAFHPHVGGERISLWRRELEDPKVQGCIRSSASDLTKPVYRLSDRLGQIQLS